VEGRRDRGVLETYKPLVEVRTILTGFSSRISSTNRFPEKAAARARAVRDRDDDFGSRSPRRSDCSPMLPRLPVTLLLMSIFASLADEALPLFPIDFEDNNPLDARFVSLAKIPFIIAVSFFTASSSATPEMYRSYGVLGKGFNVSRRRNLSSTLLKIKARKILTALTVRT